MRSTILKHSVVVAGHKTSISLEEQFWNGLKEIAQAEDITLTKLVEKIDNERSQNNLSSAIRLFVLDHYQRQLAELSADAFPAAAPGHSTYASKLAAI